MASDSTRSRIDKVLPALYAQFFSNFVTDFASVFLFVHFGCCLDILNGVNQCLVCAVDFLFFFPKNEISKKPREFGFTLILILRYSCFRSKFAVLFFEKEEKDFVPSF